MSSVKRQETGVFITMIVIQYLLYAAALIGGALSISYSIRARQQKNAPQRGSLTAKMNISMGVTMTAIALIQLFLFPYSTVRIVVGVLFLGLGIVNLGFGTKHLRYFQRQGQSTGR